MLNIMRITMAAAFTLATTIIGFAVSEPVVGLIGLLSSIMFLKADWSRN
jgi:hypothetical protein